MSANNSPFIKKTILKAIMKRTRLKNKFIKYRCERNKRAYNAQRNLCVSLVRKAKKNTLITLTSETSLICQQKVLENCEAIIYRQRNES